MKPDDLSLTAGRRGDDGVKLYSGFTYLEFSFKFSVQPNKRDLITFAFKKKRKLLLRILRLLIDGTGPLLGELRCNLLRFPPGKILYKFKCMRGSSSRII